jgi:hypothetical protein
MASRRERRAMPGLHADNDEPQFRGDGAAQRHVADGLVVDLHLELVEGIVRRDDLVREGDVRIHQGLHGEAGLVDGTFAHLQQVRTEGFQLGVEESFHGNYFYGR